MWYVTPKLKFLMRSIISYQIYLFTSFLLCSRVLKNKKSYLAKDKCTCQKVIVHKRERERNHWEISVRRSHLWIKLDKKSLLNKMRMGQRQPEATQQQQQQQRQPGSERTGRFLHFFPFIVNSISNTKVIHARVTHSNNTEGEN